MSDPACRAAPPASVPASAPLAPHVRRQKQRLLEADYEICLARARYFTEVYRETEGLDPALRNAMALRRTLERQEIFISPDEALAGSKTERFLSTPLSVERGDFLRVLQLELDILERKQRPFSITDEDRSRFWDEILPYWDGRTVHDAKARMWQEDGLIATRPGLLDRLRGWRDNARFADYVGKDNLKKILGANFAVPLSLRRLRNLWSLRFDLAYVNPTPAVHCMDVQGHLTLGLAGVVEHGMEPLIERARARRAQLAAGGDADPGQLAFLSAVVISLEAAIGYAERFAALAAQRAAAATATDERARLERIARHLGQVPRRGARSFAEGLQSAWMTQVVGEIQFGTMDVFGVGRIDQYLYPLYARDRAAGTLTDDQAVALLQEYFLKLSANVSPTPELGMESNAVLGNSQHCVTIGGVARDGADAVNPLSELVLRAYRELHGAVNQLCVRIADQNPREFTRHAVDVFRATNGIAFYSDRAIVGALERDGYDPGAARDYTIVGCVETCGHGDTQGCVAGHDFILPAVLLLTLSDGAYPPALPGQQLGYPSGELRGYTSFERLMAGFERQLAHQLDVMVRAIAGKDRAHRDQLPAPYVSALIDGCIDKAADITAGGARYDFTSIDVRGLATLVDSLLAIRHLVFERGEVTLAELVEAMLDDFRDHESLRQRLIHAPPKYGRGDAEADALAVRVVDMVHAELAERRNIRGGRFRAAYFSLGNHVIDGILLGATPDGRHRGSPISNGISPSNLIGGEAGPQAAMRSAARLPADQVSSGIALNLRFHPNVIADRRGLETFTAMLETYFALGGMHLQPNFVSTELLRDAQRHPERYRDLIVKVSGYSACFTDLGRSIQDDIIARAEFGEPG